MGKFTNTSYTNTIDKLVDATKSKLNNPYYIFTDKKPTKVTYYAQNIEKSTLDEASGLYEAHVGDASAFRYNKIKDFIIYGIERITTDYDVSDFGTESAPISGDAVILPNTITPRPGDFFAISYVKETLLFKVNGVTSDTLDTGANFYKIEYAAEIAIEHHLGLTCDPICGIVQIPCIERNAVAAMRAINAVNLASFLWDSRKISFDKVVQTMKETGHDLSSSYKETSEAGLAKINL